MQIERKMFDPGRDLRQINFACALYLILILQLSNSTIHKHLEAFLLEDARQ